MLHVHSVFAVKGELQDINFVTFKLPNSTSKCFVLNEIEFRFGCYLQCGHWGLCSVSQRWRQNKKKIIHIHVNCITHMYLKQKIQRKFGNLENKKFRRPK